MILKNQLIFDLPKRKRPTESKAKNIKIPLFSQQTLLRFNHDSGNIWLNYQICIEDYLHRTQDRQTLNVAYTQDIISSACKYHFPCSSFFHYDFFFQKCNIFEVIYKMEASCMHVSPYACACASPAPLTKILQKIKLILLFDQGTVFSVLRRTWHMAWTKGQSNVWQSEWLHMLISFINHRGPRCLMIEGPGTSQREEEQDVTEMKDSARILTFGGM